MVSVSVLPNDKCVAKPADMNGRVTALWAQSTYYASADYFIWANQYTPGVGWATAEPIEANAEWAEKPQLVVDSNGDATAIWLQSGSVWANRFDAP